MNIIGNIRRYVEHHNKGDLFNELEPYRHRLDWPLMNSATFAFGNLYNEQYSLPSGIQEEHYGVDLDTFSGTEVISPENSQLLLAVKDRRKGNQKVVVSPANLSARLSTTNSSIVSPLKRMRV